MSLVFDAKVLLSDTIVFFLEHFAFSRRFKGTIRQQKSFCDANNAVDSFIRRYMNFCRIFTNMQQNGFFLSFFKMTLLGTFVVVTSNSYGTNLLNYTLFK